LNMRLRLLRLCHDKFLSHQSHCSLGVHHETLIRGSRNQFDRLDLGQSRVPITHLSRALEADRTDFRGKPEAPAPEAKPERAEDLEKAPVGAEPCGALAINQACPDGVTTSLPSGTKQA
jgi:hypothetical protein